MLLFQLSCCLIIFFITITIICITQGRTAANALKLVALTVKQQDAQLSQRDRAAGYISFGRKWKTGTQRQYFTDIVSLASTTVT